MFQHGRSNLHLLTVVITVCLATAAFADTGMGRHKKMYVVPAPGKVTIDGKLNDWDLSGQITMYVVSETSDMQRAQFALMYDKDAFYLSGVVRDPTPLMNRHDPKVEADKGWDADSCQFRLTLDPKMGYPINIGFGQGDMANTNIVHLLLWQFTDTQEACLQMHTSMNYKVPQPEWAPFGVVPHALFQAKYVKMTDGRGYTFEYRIPWSTLGAKVPLKGGDLVAGTVQFQWSRPDGIKTAGYSGWSYDVLGSPGGVPYQTTSIWGKIIFSPKGNLPREMVEEGVAPVKPLPLKFTYDLPEDSQITIQLKDKQNIVRRILVPQGNRQAGKNVEIWDGMDDQGNLLPAGDYTWQGIYHQPLTTKFLFSPHNSGTPPYATDDGTGGWGGDHGTVRDVCAFPGGMIFCWNSAEVGWGMIRTDLTGKKQWGTMHGGRYLATDGKRIFVAGDDGFNREIGVKVYDITDARLLNYGNGTPQLAAPAGGNETLDAATGIAYADGVISVSYRARNLVGRFDAQSGDLKGTWTVPAPGRLAPRPGGGLAVISGDTVVNVADGVVIPLLTAHLDQPQGIACGPDGLLYVANAGALQNISVFDARGTYLRSIGTAGGRPAKGRYSQQGMLEPGGIALDKNDHLWVAETLDYPKRISEWDAKTGAFVNEFFGGCAYFGYAYIDPTHPDEIYCHNVLWKIDWEKNTTSPVSTVWRNTTPNMMWPQGPGGYNETPVYFTDADGKQYCFGKNTFMNILSRRDGDLYKPIAGYVTLARGNVWYPAKVQYPLMTDETKYPNGSYFWMDRNDDQTLQDDELALLPEKPGPEWDARVDKEMNRLINEGAGWVDPKDGGVFSCTTGTKENWLAKRSKDGNLLWAFPGMESWPYCFSKPMQAPGRLYGLTNWLGMAGDFTGMCCYFGPYHVLTSDGIYVGMLLRDPRDGKGLGPDVTATEVCAGQLVKLDNLPGSAGKSRYFLIAGAADARVTEVFGLDTIKRLPGGTLTLSEADVKTATDAWSDYQTKMARSKRPSVPRGKQALASAESMAKTDESGRGFTARAAYDADNLYVSFDVTSPNELVNAYPDPTLLFKGGNCLDIQLAADPQADPKRKTPAPGDVRILVTRKDGKPLAVIYRPKVKGFTGTPTLLTSPANKESFDVIEISDKIGLEYQKTAAGYQAVVTIPQAVVGLALHPGQQLLFDLGVRFGNALGNTVSGRLYWINNSAAAHVLNDVPTESRLEPAEWGTVVVE